MSKNCPFKTKNGLCNPDCALYIAPEDLNEFVMNKLASLGLMSRTEGICAYKHMALCMGRKVFENTQSRLGR